MTELKTLKDIQEDGIIHMETEGEDNTLIKKTIQVSQLRQEAIKRIKHILPKIEGCRLIDIEETPSLGAKITWEYVGEKGEMDDYWCGMITAYVDFFNITKEDLK